MTIAAACGQLVVRKERDKLCRNIFSNIPGVSKCVADSERIAAFTDRADLLRPSEEDADDSYQHVRRARAAAERCSD